MQKKTFLFGKLIISLNLELLNIDFNLKKTNNEFKNVAINYSIIYRSKKCNCII
jgi:hypothetical protein